MERSRTSLLIDDVAARLWDQSGAARRGAGCTSTNLARLIEYFGKTKPLTDIDHNEAKRMVAWRRGHRVKGRADAPLIANATVNRITTKVLQRLFTFAKAEGAMFEREPKWGELLLPEPVERVRELQDDEAAALDDAMRDDYGPFFAFVRASGLRQRECVTLRWSEVNFGTRQIVRTGKGGRRVVFPITDSIREILFPLQGQHPEFVFTYVAVYGNKRLGIVRGQRYPLTINGAKSAWQRMRRQGRRQGLPLPRLPARLRHQAAARNRQPQAGAEGAQPRRHQVARCDTRTFSMRTSPPPSSASRSPEQSPELGCGRSCNAANTGTYDTCIQPSRGFGARRPSLYEHRRKPRPTVWAFRHFFGRAQNAQSRAARGFVSSALEGGFGAAFLQGLIARPRRCSRRKSVRWIPHLHCRG